MKPLCENKELFNWRWWTGDWSAKKLGAQSSEEWLCTTQLWVVRPTDQNLSVDPL